MRCRCCRSPGSRRSAASADSRSPGSGCPAPIPRPAPVATHRCTASRPCVLRPDTRDVGRKRSLMFGPYAGWSPKFLKTGRYTDLIESVKPSNITQMMAVAPPNLDLMVYLGSQLAATHHQRFEALREYMPSAREGQWEEVTAGQRVQVIAPDRSKHGVLQFGTQLITAADGPVGGMVGASPGGATAPSPRLGRLARRDAQ